jgi:hypothetical protein
MTDEKSEFSDIELTIAILDEIPGGAEVIEWFEGRPHFGDGEVLELRLVREGPNVLRISAMTYVGGEVTSSSVKHAVFTFFLRDMVDVRLDGFGRQNVTGGVTLRRSRVVDVHPSLYGIGLAIGDHEIVLQPCAGAFGFIRCSIERISISPVDDYQKADRA